MHRYVCVQLWRAYEWLQTRSCILHHQPGTWWQNQVTSLTHRQSASWYEHGCLLASGVNCLYKDLSAPFRMAPSVEVNKAPKAAKCLEHLYKICPCSC